MGGDVAERPWPCRRAGLCRGCRGAGTGCRKAASPGQVPLFTRARTAGRVRPARTAASSTACHASDVVTGTCRGTVSRNLPRSSAGRCLRAEVFGHWGASSVQAAPIALQLGSLDTRRAFRLVARTVVLSILAHSSYRRPGCPIVRRTHRDTELKWNITSVCRSQPGRARPEPAAQARVRRQSKVAVESCCSRRSQIRNDVPFLVRIAAESEASCQGREPTAAGSVCCHRPAGRSSSHGIVFVQPTRTPAGSRM